MLLILALLCATHLAESKYLKPRLDSVTMPPIHDLSFETQRHTLQKTEIGTMISIKMVPFGRVDLQLHANRLGATDVVPFLISFRPEEKTLVFNSLVDKNYDYEQRKWVPFETYKEIQLDIHLQENSFFCVINEFYLKTFDYPFEFEKLEFLTLKGYSLLKDVQEVEPEPEVEETELSGDDEEDTNEESEDEETEDSENDDEPEEASNDEQEATESHNEGAEENEESDDLQEDDEIEEIEKNNRISGENTF